MKLGLRKPSVKKSLKARTTGKLKRSVKKSVNPLYGKKGMGLINNPKKAIYNKAYSKTTISIWSLFALPFLFIFWLLKIAVILILLPFKLLFSIIKKAPRPSLSIPKFESSTQMEDYNSEDSNV